MVRKIEIPCPKCGSKGTSLTRDTIEYHCFDCGYYFGQEDADEYGWFCNKILIKLEEHDDTVSFTLRRGGKWFGGIDQETEIEELCRLAENFDKEWEARVGQNLED